MKKVTILLHGLGQKGTGYFDELVPKLELCQDLVMNVELFNRTKKIPSWKEWVDEAELVIAQYIDEDTQVTLIGYSMGALIAVYLSTKFKVHKMILLAPAFYILGLHVFARVWKMLIKPHKSHEPNEVFSMIREHIIWNPLYYFNFLIMMIKMRNHTKTIQCPTKIYLGTEDELIPLKSVQSIIKQMIHGVKVIIISGGRHELLVHAPINSFVLRDIIEFMLSESEHNFEVSLESIQTF